MEQLSLQESQILCVCVVPSHQSLPFARVLGSRFPKCNQDACQDTQESPERTPLALGTLACLVALGKTAFFICIENEGISLSPKFPWGLRTCSRCLL